MSEITLLAEVTAFLRQPHGQFIAGHRETGHGAPFAVINPATGEAIAEITAADVGQADRAMESARQAFNQWREMPTLARGALLLKLADTLAEHREELAQLESLCSGKTIMLARMLELDQSVAFLRYFAGWAPPVQKLIAVLDPQTTNRIEIHDIEPFDKLVRGKVALLGDAGHSTTPDIGQGGCAAMEDAVVLGNVLRDNSDIVTALRQYEALRCERVRDLVLKARKRCDITHGKDMALTKAWYQELKTETGERIINGLCETIQGGPLG